MIMTFRAVVPTRAGHVVFHEEEDDFCPELQHSEVLYNATLAFSRLLGQGWVSRRKKHTTWEAVMERWDCLMVLTTESYCHTCVRFE